MDETGWGCKNKSIDQSRWGKMLCFCGPSTDGHCEVWCEAQIGKEKIKGKKKNPKKQKKDVPCWSALLCLVCYWEIKQEMYLVSKLRQTDRLGCRHHVTNSQMAGKIVIMSMMSEESKGSQFAAVALNTWIRKGVKREGGQDVTEQWKDGGQELKEWRLTRRKAFLPYQMHK